MVKVTIKWGKVVFVNVELNTAAPVSAFKDAVYALTGECEWHTRRCESGSSSLCRRLPSREQCLQSLLARPPCTVRHPSSPPIASSCSFILLIMMAE